MTIYAYVTGTYINHFQFLIPAKCLKRSFISCVGWLPNINFANVKPNELIMTILTSKNPKSRLIYLLVATILIAQLHLIFMCSFAVFHLAIYIFLPVKTLYFGISVSFV